MPAHPHATASTGAGGLAAPDTTADDGPVAPITPIRVAERRRDRRRRRRQAEHDGRVGLPGLGTAPGEVTPTVLRLEARYQDEVHAVLHGAIRAAAPLCARRGGLLQWIEQSTRELADERARHAADRPAHERGRSRGEEHLSRTELTERVRAEAARETERHALDLRNRHTLLAERRLALQRTEEGLDALVERTRAHAEAVRTALVGELADYVGELVRHHPDGDLLGRLNWPTRFAVPPEWVSDPAVLRRRLRAERPRHTGPVGVDA